LLPRTKALFKRLSQGHGATLVKERLLHVSTLTSGFRIAVYGSYVVIVFVAALISLHRTLEDTHHLSAFGLSIPAGVIAAGTPVLVVALIVILAGAMLSNRRLRYAVVGLTAVLLLPIGSCARSGIVCCDPQQVVQARPSVLLLTLLFEPVAVLLLTVALFYRKLRPSQIAALCSLAVLLPLGMAWLISAKWNPGFGLGLILFTWMCFMYVILPSLVLVGLDLTEWSLLFAGLVGDAMHGRIWPIEYIVACVALLANVALAGFSLHWKDAAIIGMRSAVVAAVMGFLLALFAILPEAPHEPHLRHLKLLAMAALTVYGASFIWMNETDAPPPVFNYNGERSFSIRYPEGWKSKLLYQGRELVLFRAMSDNPTLLVEGHSRSPNGTQYINDLLPGKDDGQFPRTRIAYEPTRDEEWDKFETTLKSSLTMEDIHFIVWHLDTPSEEWFLDSDWYVIGISNLRQLADSRPKFEAAWRSFTLTPRTVPAPLNRRIVLAIWGAIALLGIVWLLIQRRRAKPALALLVAVAGVVLAINVAPGDLTAEEAEFITLAETLYCVQIVLSIVSGIVLLWLMRTRVGGRNKVIQLILGLNIAFLLVYAFSSVYAFGAESGERSDAAKGIVVLVALSWEIATSGELTNHATRSFPRNSRVLLFLGYVLLVAFAVLTFFQTTFKLTGRLTAFDSERWVTYGIVILGVPFLMVVFASRIAPLLWPKESQRTESPIAADLNSPPTDLKHGGS
jgi:hypothetical protein